MQKIYTTLYYSDISIYHFMSVHISFFLFKGLFLKLSTIDPTTDVKALIKSAKEMDITPEHLRASVVNARQYGKFLRMIECELNQMLKDIEKIIDSFKSCMKKLHILISDRPAVPSNEVYVRYSLNYFYLIIIYLYADHCFNICIKLIAKLIYIAL